jgi:predicted  nucleic acid-binding Zn-ribbon protein
MNPDLGKLLDLQDRDLELLDVDTRLLEVEAEIGVLDDELNKAREAVAAVDRSIEAEKKRRDELEGKVEQHRKHQERRKEKLEFMKTPKEVASLMAEIDLARSALGNEENEWIKASDQVTSLETRKKQAQDQVETITTRQTSARSALDEKRKTLQAEHEEVAGRRATSAAAVRKPLLQRYDKLRTSSNRRSMVVVALNGAACGACFTTVPLSRRTVIKSGEAVEGCESCGVILYFPE